jgi:O-antigen ligase
VFLVFVLGAAIRLALSPDLIWVWMLLFIVLAVLVFPLEDISILAICAPLTILVALRAIASYGIWIGTFGNRNFFGGFLASAALIALCELARIWKSRRAQPADSKGIRGQILLWTVLGVIALVGLVRCWSKGSWLGLAAGIGWVLAAFVLRNRLRPRVVLVSLLITVGLLLSWFARANGPLDYQGADARPYLWQGGWTLVADHPLLGVGPERMIDQWPAVRPEGYLALEDAGDVSPYVHHWSLQFLIEWGIPVGLLWCVFLGGALVAPTGGNLRRIAMQGVIMVILVQNWVDAGLFHTPLREMTFWIAAGLWAPVTGFGGRHLIEKPTDPHWLQRGMIGIILIVVFSRGVFWPWMGNRHAIAGHQAADRGDYAVAVPELSASVEWGPGIRREERYRLGYCLYQSDALASALQVYTDLAHYSPDFSQLNANLTRVLLRMKEFEAALPFAERQVELYPSDADNWVRLASCLLELGRIQEGREMLERAVELNPEHAFARSLLDRLGKEQ